MKMLGRVRQGLLVKGLSLAAGRRRRVQIGGLKLRVERGVCDPAPAFGASFLPLFEAALVGLEGSERVLEIGTGCGVWALLAQRALKAASGTSQPSRVTATDLPQVDLSPVIESARENSLAIPRLLQGDLFAPLVEERFDRVLFNPPFHVGAPQSAAERSYLGGAEGEVLKRFLRLLPQHLLEGGSAFVILPRIEREAYRHALAPLGPQVREQIWMPLLGGVELLELS